MDKQDASGVELEVLGRRDLPEGAQDRPLVTFAIFAYNQERYIRAAVNGAFSQDYEPLEIILSDDCSSDGTFEIMRDMALQYNGIHQVRVVKTSRNLGVSRHVLLRCKEASGQIIVVAAGDDVSHPLRCAEHVAHYGDPYMMGISGGYDLIDEAGNIIKKSVIEPVAKNAKDNQMSFFRNLEYPYTVIQGSTASYRKELFSIPLPDWDFLISEDNLLNYLIYANGYYVGFLPKPLIFYRMHDQAESNHSSKINNRQPLENYEKFQKITSGQIQLANLLRWLSESSENSSRINLEAVESRASIAKTKMYWSNYGLIKRFYLLGRSIRARDFAMVQWKFLRLFGRYPKFQPRYFIFRYIFR